MTPTKSFSEFTYEHSPVFLQNFLVSLYGRKLYRREYGREFERLLPQFLRMEGDASALADYRIIKLRQLIDHSYNNVPYYRELMDQHGIKPKQLQTPEDLKLLPVLTRETVREKQASLLATNIKPNQRILGKTSGTTGSPLQFYWDAETCRIKNVVDWRQKAAAGLKPFERMAFFLGRPIVPLHWHRAPYWRENRTFNQLFFSSFHLSDQTLPAYLAALRQYQPAAIEGYPSTLSIVARWLNSRGETFPVRAAFTSSETLHQTQREEIERAFACPLFDYYGMAERVVFATECDRHSGKHLNDDFGITEILADSSGMPAAPGELGRVVATGLHNLTMPLIRYQTSDISAFEKVQCDCGRVFPLMSNITTKAEDLITTPDGRLIASSILTHPFKPLRSIVESQLVQESRELLVVKIVKSSNYSLTEEAFLLNELQARVGPQMQIRLEFVDAIPRTAAGKFRWVISKVPPPF